MTDKKHSATPTTSEVATFTSDYARKKYEEIQRRMQEALSGGNGHSIIPLVAAEKTETPPQIEHERKGSASLRDKPEQEQDIQPVSVAPVVCPSPDKPAKGKRGRKKGSRVVNGKVVVPDANSEYPDSCSDSSSLFSHIETIQDIQPETAIVPILDQVTIEEEMILNGHVLETETVPETGLAVLCNENLSLAVAVTSDFIDTVEGELVEDELVHAKSSGEGAARKFCFPVSIRDIFQRFPLVRSVAIAGSIGIMFVAFTYMFSFITLDSASADRQTKQVEIKLTPVKAVETPVNSAPVRGIKETTIEFEMVGTELQNLQDNSMKKESPVQVIAEDEQEEVIPDIRSSLDDNLVLNSVLDDDRETELLEIKEMKLNLLRKQLESKSSKVTVQEEKKEKRTTDSRQEDIDKLASYIEKVRTGNSSVSREEMQKIAVNVYKYSDKYNLPVGLVVGVMQTESNFRPSAVSSADARGLMQVMWKYHSARLQKVGIKTKEELHDVEKGIHAGCIVLAGYIEAEKSITKALGRYYGVLHQQYVSTVKSYWETFELVNAGMLDEAEWKVAVEKTRAAWSNLFARVSTSNKSSSSSSSSAAKKQSETVSKATPAKTATTTRIYNNKITIKKSDGTTRISDDSAERVSSTMIYNNKITIKKSDGTTKTWTDRN